jgi:hypothetical protein
MSYVSVTDHFSSEGVDASASRAEERLAAALTRFRQVQRQRSRPAGTRAAVGASAVPSARPRPARTRRPTVEVDHFAAAQIRKALRYDGLESGGPVLTVKTEDGFRVVDALGPPPDSEHELRTSSFWLDLERARGWAQYCAEQGLPGLLRGDWHSHPARNATEPSEADKTQWARCRGRSFAPAWVGVIVADDPAGLAPARWAAYVTTKSGTEPATLLLPPEE